jgi:transaldolase
MLHIFKRGRRMKIFLDTADVEAIKRINDTGFLDGITTNPAKIAETGRRLNTNFLLSFL